MAAQDSVGSTLVLNSTAAANSTVISADRGEGDLLWFGCPVLASTSDTVTLEYSVDDEVTWYPCRDSSGTAYSWTAPFVGILQGPYPVVRFVKTGANGACEIYVRAG